MKRGVSSNGLGIEPIGATTELAERFGVSFGRVSQLRRELHEGWYEFQREVVGEAA